MTEVAHTSELSLTVKELCVGRPPQISLHGERWLFKRFFLLIIRSAVYSPSAFAAFCFRLLTHAGSIETSGCSKKKFLTLSQPFESFDQTLNCRQENINISQPIIYFQKMAPSLDSDCDSNRECQSR